MDIESLFKHKAFTSLDPSQLLHIRQFAKDIQGKGATEVARLYMQLNQKISVTMQQRNDIIDAIRNFLPEKDRQKLNGFIRMMGR